MRSEWVDTKKFILNIPLQASYSRPRDSAFRSLCYTTVGKRQFELGIISVIILNTVLLSCQFYDQPDDLTQFLSAINIAFTCVFVIELLMKVAAYGWLGYWTDPWNKFDLFVVLASLIGLMVNTGST